MVPMYYDCGQAIVPMYYDTKEFDLRMSHGVELVRLVAAARCAHVGTSEFFWRICLSGEIPHSRLARLHGNGSFLGHFATVLHPGRADLITVG
jgi:hypothetical protein